ncbi:MAG TPA: DNA translocase FtsK 4TM domain-containing protein [Candidatus Limnocylindria bacterium]
MAKAKSRSRRQKRARRAANTGIRISRRVVREVGAIVLVVLALVSLLAILTPDAAAGVALWRDFLETMLGWGIFFAPALLLLGALLLWMRTVPTERIISALGVGLVAASLLGIFQLAVGGPGAVVPPGDGGGVIGTVMCAPLVYLLGTAGAAIVLFLLLVVGFLLFFNMTIGDVFAAWQHRQEEIGPAAAAAAAASGGASTKPGVSSPPSRPVPEEPPLILRRQRAEPATAGAAAAAAVAVPIVSPAPATAAELEEGEEAHLAEVGEPQAVDAALELPQEWALPDLSLLADAPGNGPAQMDLTAKGQRIKETLNSFDIGVKVARIQEGPVVTQYALDVEPGIKLSRIQGLADNLALALSARSIRIQAPIPGEPYVGIEIPNAAFDLVTLKEVLGSKALQSVASEGELAFALGQDVAGQPVAADLGRMPHLLIAGATGSGKSVCVNALICSLVMRAKPDEVKLILIDPKRVELAQYRGLPHLLTEVIVDTEKAVNALKWTVGAMESRYHEFAQRGVRNIAGYNAELKASEPRMPYIVVVIDELADLMMMSAYEVEATITRIAQLARATGIHLVVATQRPSVQVVTGLIKANIPSRIAFAMTSGIDSRTILDATGAEDLLGRGDMLYLPIDAPRATRLQGVLVTDPEIEALTRFWKNQGSPRYRTEITATRRDSRGGGDGEDDGDADPLLRQAIDIVRRSDKASASLLQRRLRVGYARAARILDQMEDRGIVGPADGSRFREVLITPDGWGGEIGPGEDAE